MVYCISGTVLLILRATALLILHYCFCVLLIQHCCYLDSPTDTAHHWFCITDTYALLTLHIVHCYGIDTAILMVHC